MPPTRELAKGNSREGREGGPNRKCSRKMALAMENWLQQARKESQETGGPPRAHKEMTGNRDMRTRKEREK